MSFEALTELAQRVLFRKGLVEDGDFILIMGGLHGVSADSKHHVVKGTNFIKLHQIAD